MALIDSLKEEVGRMSINDRAMLAYWIIINLEEIDEPQEAVDDPGERKLEIGSRKYELGKQE